jgi:DNA-binding CsgD family transcriptional regulator
VLRSPKWVTVDVVVASTLAVASQLEIWAPRFVPGVGEVTGNRPILAVTALVATMVLALRRRFPLTVLVVVMGALGTQQVLTTPTEGLVLLLVGMIAAYSSSAYASVTHAAAAGLVILAVSAVIGQDAGDWTFLAVVFGGAWLIGFVVMQRSTDLTRVRQDNRELSQRLDEAADQLADAQRRLSTGPASDKLAALTAREIEVARVVAKGMSNAEIASDLFISEWTVKTHVASILRKLGLRDRAQVVVAAYESGIVRPRSAADAEPPTTTS